METPSTLSATGRCKHWLSGDYTGQKGYCPHCEIEHLHQWQDMAAAVLARFVNLGSRPNEEEWGRAALVATRLVNMRSNVAIEGPEQAQLANGPDRMQS